MKSNNLMFDLADEISRQNEVYVRGMAEGVRKELDLLRRLVAAFDIDNYEEVVQCIEEARSLIS